MTGCKGDDAMGRRAKPWYREFDGCWYATISSKKMRLLKAPRTAEKAAQDAFEKLKKEHEGVYRRDLDPCYKLCDAYLTHVEKAVGRGEVTDQTFRLYSYFLNTFTAQHGKKIVRKLTTEHAEQWLDAHDWNPSSRAYATAVLKRCFRWARERKHISENPFDALRKGAGLRRKRTLTEKEQRRMLAHAPEPFRTFLRGLFGTGCRPGELRNLTVKDCDVRRGIWVLHDHKTSKKTKEPRVVWLSPEMIELSKELLAKYRTGYLFRNARGRQWTKENVIQRMARLREELGLGKDVVCYTARHTYATQALQKHHLGIATVAALLGHKSIKTTSQYDHVGDQYDHMKKAASEIRPPA